MNILFFLTPKSEVIYVNEEDTVGQAMNAMKNTVFCGAVITHENGSVTQEH